jgi:DNA polymerase kappa
MPGFIGKKLCPELVIVTPHFDKYREVSQQVQEILTEYDPNFAMMSLDEAYLDFTAHMELRQNLLEQERTFVKMPKFATCKCQEEKTCDVTDNSVFSENVPETSTVEVTHNISGLKNLKQEDNINVVTADEVNCSMCGLERWIARQEDEVTFGKTVEDAVTEMRFRIEQKTWLTASAGTCEFFLLHVNYNYPSDFFVFNRP